MSLFRREPESQASSAPLLSQRDAAPAERKRPAASQQITHIAPGTRVQGQIMGTTEVLIEGGLEGDVKISNRAVIGSEGQVVGTIQARSIRVAGRVRGDVSCQERVEILESGTLEGDVTAPRVVISEGAFFKGKVEMNEPKSSGAQAPPAATINQRTTAKPAANRTGGAAEKSESKR